MTSNALPDQVLWAVEAAQDKQALDVSVLDLSGTGAFADYFLLCSAESTPQIQAIGHAVEEKLHVKGALALAHREGKGSADWVLLDYGFLVVHIFSEGARQYYDLERLWRTTKRVDFPANGKSLQTAPRTRAESEGNASRP
jgi:ribosome-associated protein